MPRSSKHKSRKDYSYSDSDEDVKMKEKEKEKSSKEESVVAKVSKDLTSEKRKLSSGKDVSGYGNGDVAEEYVSSSKRRKEKADGSSGGGGGNDRWNGAVDGEVKGESSKIDADNKGLKGKETKSLGELKSNKNSKKEGSSSSVAVSLVEKEESKSGRVESKRKSEKDSAARKEGGKDSKEKERGSDREKKGQESKRDAGDNVKKQGSQSGDVSEERQGKKGRENADWSIQTEAQNLDVDKESEKRARKRREVSGDRDKYEDPLNETDDRRLPSRSERTKDEKHRHDKHKDYKEDGDKDDKHRDDRYREDADKDKKRRDDKYREDGDRDSRRRDDKYLEDVDRDSRRRDEKYRDDGDRDNRRKDDRYREDDDRDSRRRDDKYREGGDSDNKHRDDKYREYGEKDGRHDEDRYHEDGERDDRQRDFKYREDSERDKRRKDEKHREDVERHGRCKDGDEADESDKKRRLSDAKYGDERAPRDHSGDRSDAKRSRDDGHASDLHLRKSSIHERSPGYDDRTRYKDELGRRRTYDKEDLGDIRSRSTKELRSEAEKRSTSSARVETIADRGRSTSRNADIELTPKKGRWRTSPGPHTTRDNYRLSKQEELKYRDYPYEDRIRHGTTSRDYAGSGGSIERISSRSTEKLMQKDDTFHGDFSAERRVKSDVRSSPLQMVDRSPPPASNERRHLSRSDVRRSLDVEESTQRSGGSRDVKEGRGNRDFAGDALAGDELSQIDGDNVSVSSPFIRGSHLSGSSKSTLPPPPPFRSGVDSPSMFGSLEDDNRGKSTNRHRRMNDPTLGRMQGNAWKGVPNWPSPLANGFMPFQHGPPPVGFHPAMQQFPGPPIFGVRPSMDLGHPGVPYHIQDADRFSGHGRPMGWRTPMDDSCGPPLHGWDANNFGEEAHLYGRPEWDQTRTLSNNSRSWETSGDAWKGPMRGTSVELPSGSQKEVCSIQGPGDGSFAAQSAQQVQSEQKQVEDAESNDISQSSSVPGRSTPEDLNPEEQPIDVKPSAKEEARLCNVYLSKLDISADLTEQVLFDQCASLMDVDQNMTSDVYISKILFLEGVVESNVTLPSKFSSTSLNATVADSVFQKAISLYKKGRDEIKLIHDGKCPVNGQLGEFCAAPKLENSSPDYGKVEEAAMADDGPAEDGDKGVDLPASSEEEVGLSPTCQEVCEAILNPTEKSDLPPPMVERVVMEVDTVLDVAEESKIGENSSSLEEVGRSDALAPLVSEDLMGTGISILDDVKEEEKLVDAKCGPKLHPDVSSEVFEAMMPESIESESVNLSRIHHSPESTH